MLGLHRKQVEEQMAELQANLDEIKLHEKEARALLTKAQARTTKNQTRSKT